jgi:hypothetical protein
MLRAIKAFHQMSKILPLCCHINLFIYSRRPKSPFVMNVKIAEDHLVKAKRGGNEDEQDEREEGDRGG